MRHKRCGRDAHAARRLLLRALGMGAVAALLAFARRRRSPEAARKLLVWPWAARRTLYYLPLTIAEHLGYFKDEGLNLEIQRFPGRREGAAGADGRQRRRRLRRVRAHHRHADAGAEGAGLRAAGHQSGHLASAWPPTRRASYSWPKDMKGMAGRRERAGLEHAHAGQPSARLGRADAGRRVDRRRGHRGAGRRGHEERAARCDLQRRSGDDAAGEAGRDQDQARDHHRQGSATKCSAARCRPPASMRRRPSSSTTPIRCRR